MVINLKNIPVEGTRIAGKDPVSVLDIEAPDIRFEKDIEVEVWVYKVSGKVIVKCITKVYTGLVCSRCARDFGQWIVNPEFDYLFDITEDQEELDITPQVRESILLSLPMKPLCNPDCKGLCPYCGKDLNIESCECKQKKVDPRWKKLDQIDVNEESIKADSQKKVGL